MVLLEKYETQEILLYIKVEILVFNLENGPNPPGLSRFDARAYAPYA